MTMRSCQQHLKRKWIEEEQTSSSSVRKGKSTSSNRNSYERGTGSGPSANFSDSNSEDDDEEKPFDRESLLRDIDADIKSIINEVKNERKENIKIKKEEDILNTAAAVTSNYRGADGALYTLEIFMREKRTCRWVIVSIWNI